MPNLQALAELDQRIRASAGEQQLPSDFIGFDALLHDTPANAGAMVGPPMPEAAPAGRDQAMAKLEAMKRRKAKMRTAQDEELFQKLQDGIRYDGGIIRSGDLPPGMIPWKKTNGAFDSLLEQGQGNPFAYDPSGLTPEDLRRLAEIEAEAQRPPPKRRRKK